MYDKNPPKDLFILFNSYEFIFLFLPLTFFIYFYLNSKKLTEASKGFLVVSSLFFYSWWNIVYLPLILISMVFNYVLGNSLSKEHTNKKAFSKKSLLTFGVIANLSLLGYFKYSDFFIENINYFSGSNIDLLHLALPLAISFFTFQQIAYLVDSYKNETHEYDFLNYAIFVSFFPQLIAGPIVHHKEMMPQFALTRNKIKNYRNIALGIFIFSMGLFKKVVIADNLAVWATTGFDVAETLTFFEGWITSLTYTFQLYFDFSGYTDMAIGVALLFNIKLPINFNSPYKALDIQDFWRRWHMTLSRFLRDYVYIPLGGSKKGSFRTYNNLMATFVLGGLWHGAGWTFIFWGFLHGLALIIHRAWQQIGFRLPKLLAWFITFNFVNIAWVFFRAKEWDDAIKVLKAMFFGEVIVAHHWYPKLQFLHEYISAGFWSKQLGNGEKGFYFIIVAFLIAIFAKNSVQLINTIKLNLKMLLFTSIILVIALSYLNKASEFLYFNF